MCLGIVKDDSRKEYLRIRDSLTSKGCEGIILGCTEICMLIKEEHTKTRLYDTTTIHAQQAVSKALN